MGSSRSYSVTSPHSNSSTGMVGGGGGGDGIRHMKSDGHLPILETHEEKVVYIQVRNYGPMYMYICMYLLNIISMGQRAFDIPCILLILEVVHMYMCTCSYVIHAAYTHTMIVFLR